MAATTLATNAASLVQISVSGLIAAPKLPPLPGMPHVISRDGQPVIVPPPVRGGHRAAPPSHG